MRKIVIALMLCIPTMTMAQSEWEAPMSAQQKLEETRKAEAKAEKARKDAEKAAKKNDGHAVELKEDPKYMTGAVPVVDGKVTFTLNLDIPGKSAQQIYEQTYQFIDQLTIDEHQMKNPLLSQISLVNKKEHIIVARLQEWLVFSSGLLAIDRTQFNYTLIANCTDGHLNITISRIRYDYEKERETGFSITAEQWITDQYGLNKKKNDVNHKSGKFRKKTIDRKDQIFNAIKELFSK